MLWYPLDSDLSVGQRYTPFMQLGPGDKKRAKCYIKYRIGNLSLPGSLILMSRVRAALWFHLVVNFTLYTRVNTRDLYEYLNK